MSTDPFRNMIRRKLSGGIVLVLSLFLCPAQAVSEVMHTDHFLVRFVCQAHDPEHRQFLDRVLILEQVSTQPHDPGAALSDTIDGPVLIDADHEISSTDEAVFRARIFDRISLVSNLPDLFGHDIEPAADPEKLDREEDLRRYKEVRQTSLSMGSTDDEVIAGLRAREADLDIKGQRMDYMGIGARLGGRFGFRSSGPYKLSKSIDIFLTVSRGVVETGLGTWSSPEDGPYLCKEPVLVSALAASFSSCMQGNDGSVNISALANDRFLVRRIQRSLADQGFNPGPLDGILGPRTYAAFRAWRTSQGRVWPEPLMRDQLCILLHPAAGAG